MIELIIFFAYLFLGLLIAEIGADKMEVKWYLKWVVAILWLPLLIIVVIMEAWKRND